MYTERHRVDLCVIGGGLAGMSAAVAAARAGIKVALMHERPVLGGNASSEVRMWICGAHGPNNRETGIIEEIQLENIYRNPLGNYSIWDSVLYEKVRFQDNLLLLLNCTCVDATMDGARIRRVKGWQLTTQTWHEVEAEVFADCSGDSILAPLSGGEFRWGREAQQEFNESIAPEVADRRTMGMSCLIQGRETERPQTFVPPSWARSFPTDSDLPNRTHRVRDTNFWWIELGGEGDAIRDTEVMRDELLKIAFGVWDHVKNHGDHGADNWVLEWVGFLPGKRESRRYIGDYVLTQNDVQSEGRFEDVVAFGGWPLDDHPPAGFHHPGMPTSFYNTPSPFGIPYRSLYSRNIENLFCAGRNISATHAAFSSTRVMATCATVGQAVGAAAAIAIGKQLTPRGVYEQAMGQLQQALLDADCFLPWQRREISALSRAARLAAQIGDPELLRSGMDRPCNGDENCLRLPKGGWVEYELQGEKKLSEIRVVFDSDLNRTQYNGDCNTVERLDMPCHYALHVEPLKVPSSLVKSFRVLARNGGADWHEVYRNDNNYQRLVNVSLPISASALRLVPEETWGDEEARIYAWDVR